MTSPRQFFVKTKPVIAVLASVLTVVLVSVIMANAWGPERETFVMESPASYVTFNSIVDNPDWGDERGFALIKDIGTDINNNTGVVAAGPGFKNVATAIDGHYYMVQMFVHNNAATNFNLVAENTRVGFSMQQSSDSVGNPGEVVRSTMVQSKIMADNCGANDNGATGEDCSFWDEAYISGLYGNLSNVNYVSGSARLYNNVRSRGTNGFTLSDDIDEAYSSSGVQIGYETMDGDIPGCFEYSAYVTFLLQVDMPEPTTPDFTLTKKVRVKGQEEWENAITAEPGDEIEYRIDYDNIGSADQTSVIISDDMPIDVEYSPSSAILYNTGNSDGVEQTNDAWLTDGWNIGTYTPSPDPDDSSAVIEFAAILPGEEDLLCGANLFQNFGFAYTADGTKLTSADVTVNRDCGEDDPDVCEFDPSLPPDDPNCKKAEDPKPSLVPPASGILSAVTLGTVAILAATVAIFLLTGRNRSNPKSTKK